ncbi:molybdenum cofactor cytidylyltransferase [Gottschalkia purinilytica]|uniref:Molybdenum cofactor cytidylyltransferase n=1 Tax=Gottschalkia purinilytica TaxID=1503 RepID=A0A0L0WFL2_GOTPU|nr:nucleotidyltransferase family protein [Gottschalkia purinilytica]KNF10210.1 molybdenum cofactor cytidylyltransferase [Gottschalkia purinilytica]
MNVEGIVLAAGMSTRAGKYKMTLDIDGKCVIEKCIEGMYDVCSKIIVVGGYRIEEIIRVLNKYPKVEIVFNEDYKTGMFSSVKKGLKYINKDRFFITPGDYPLINKKTYKSMLNVDADIVIPRYNRRKGHPILIKNFLIEDLLQDFKYTNLREFVRTQGFTHIDIGDPGILTDIDTMEDYNMILSSMCR